MKILLMGTGASEGIPAVYCACGLCKRALERGGKDFRTRQQALIDDLLIDFGPETYVHFLRAGKTLAGVGHILVTHSHGDHLAADNFFNRGQGFAYGYDYPKIRVYAGKEVCARIRRTVPEQTLDEGFELVEVEPFCPFAAGAHTVTAFPAAHMQSEQALIYLIEKDKKAVLYCLDTGVLTGEEPYGWLKAHGKKLNAVIFDCTKGDLRQDYDTHMCMEENDFMRKKLVGCNAADGGTLFVCTHFSHNCKMTHAELESAARKYGFAVAYDGWTAEV